jgi:hypothetical protein
MKVIIAGSRTLSDYGIIELAVTNSKFTPIEIISGCAKGADRLGELFAKNHNLPVKYFPADWNRFGKAAGYKRNQQMAEYGDALVAVWDGKSKGTGHMINIMKDLNKPFHVEIYESSH